MLKKAFNRGSSIFDEESLSFGRGFQEALITARRKINDHQAQMSHIASKIQTKKARGALVGRGFPMKATPSMSSFCSIDRLILDDGPHAVAEKRVEILAPQEKLSGEREPKPSENSSTMKNKVGMGQQIRSTLDQNKISVV